MRCKAIGRRRNRRCKNGAVIFGYCMLHYIVEVKKWKREQSD